MLFENRRILVGFRIKITFDPSIQKEDFYLFIDTSKIHTVKDLLADIKNRFQIEEDLLPLLNDCHVLQTEDILVLVEASELKIIPVTENIPAGKSSRVNAPCKKRTENPPINVENVEPTNSEAKRPSPPEVRPKFSKRYNYGSVAETIRFLSRVDETSKSSTEQQNGQPEVGDVGGADNSSIREEELNGDSEKDSFSDIIVENLPKRKRKRKRKHSSKKRIGVNGDEISKPFGADTANTVPKSLTPPRVPSRSHIFFADATEAPADKEYSSIDEPDAMDIENEIPAYEVISLTEMSRGSLRNDEKASTPVSSNDSESTGTDYDSEHTDTATSTYKSLPNRTPSREITSNGGGDRSATTVKTNSTKPATSNGDRSVAARKANSTEPNRVLLPQRESDHQKPSSNFFTSIKANAAAAAASQSNSSSKEAANGALSTLLMCKQLKTHLEYFVQFAQPPPPPPPSSYTMSHSPKAEETPNKAAPMSSQRTEPEEARNSVSVAAASIKKETVEEKNEAEKLIEDDDDECKVLNPYLLNGNVIRVRDGNFWVVLTADLASKKFSLVANPKEGTTITFQLLLLGSDMCPTMTSLILGKIVLFNEEYKKVALKISSAFMEPIAKEFGNEGVLPEDIVWVESNVYELDWFSLRNPRLLM